MPHSTESEFKLRSDRDVEVAAVDAALREAGATSRANESHHHSDTYLDDAHGSLRAAGIGLRLREGPRGRRMTCKGRIADEARGGLFVRRETEAAWTREQPPRRAGELDGELRDAVEPFTLGRELLPVMRLEVDREVRLLTGDGEDICELAIDSVEALANGRSARFQEVELEVLDDAPANEQLAERLQQRLPMSFATTDKPTHAAALLGIERPRAAGDAWQRGGDVGDGDDPREPTGRAIARRLAQRLQAMRAAEVGVRGDEHPEHLHAMRVAIRRMRSLVRAFRGLWSADEDTRLLADLGEVGRQLGAVRDLDVMLERLPHGVAHLPPPLRDAGERTIGWVRAQRDRQHARLQAWLRSDERLAHAEAIERRIAALQLDGATAQVELRDAAPTALAEAVAALRKQVRSIPDELPIGPAHRLRLAAKRVRYLAEEFAELPGSDYRKSLRRVVRVQQAFGVVCDHEVAMEWLLGQVHAAATASSDGAWTAAAIGALSASHRLAALATRGPATTMLQRLDRKKTWRRFPRPAK